MIQHSNALALIERWAKLRFCQRIHMVAVTVNQGVFEKTQPRLPVGFLQGVVHQCRQRLSLEHFPGHAVEFEDLTADLFGLLLLALHLESVRLLLPFLEA